MRIPVLTRSFTFAALLAATLTAPVLAQHRDYGHGHQQWQGGRSYGGNGYNNNSGAVIGGVLLGLGVGAVLGGALAPPPPVVYAPAPAYANPYAPPPPVYYGY